MFDHPQDDLLVVVALSVFAQEFEDTEPGTADRALEMAFELAGQHGLHPADALLQLEPIEPVE